MAPLASPVSRQYGLLSRLTVSVITLLARLPRYGRGVSFFISPTKLQLKERYDGHIDLVVDRL